MASTGKPADGPKDLESAQPSPPEQPDRDASAHEETAQIPMSPDHDSCQEQPGLDLRAATAPLERQGAGEQNHEVGIRKIGPFSVRKVLGEGGMGAVYLGEQTEPVQRSVALKVVHASLRSPVALARFDAERQAMARLSHPNVAALYEAGTTDDGFPFFAMEYLPGETLVEYCDEHRLGVRERVALFIEVCEGVQHAHQKGLIHRDLKPSNLLVAVVDGVAIPKVIDFGIAKAVDQPLIERAELTGMGAIGTPAYMSPEAFSANHDLDTRTDVYSLGIVLYELLAGVRPHDLSGLALMQLNASGQRPPSQRLTARILALAPDELDEISQQRRLNPRQLADQLRADLDWIVRKATEDEREGRYPTVADLAADLRRYLANEAVLARPPSVIYQARKFVRRHRLGVISAVLVVFALVLGIVGTSVAMLRAAREAETSRQVSAFLTRIFEVSDPGVARGNSVTARELLDQAAQRIRSELTDQPLVQAQLMRTMGEVYHNLGLYDQAEPLESAALSIRRGALGSQDPEVGRSLNALGTLIADQGRYSEAEQLQREAVSVLRTSFGPDSPDLALAQVQLGLTRFLLDDPGEAEALFRSALSTLEAASGSDSLEVASVLTHLGYLLTNQGRIDEAEGVLARALRIREQLLGKDHFLVETSLHLLGDVFLKQGRTDQAEAMFTRGLAINRQIYAPDHPSIAESHFALGEVQVATGHPQLAIPHFEEGIGIVERSLGPDHINLSRGLQPLGLLLANQGRWEEAAGIFERLVAVYQNAVGEDHRWVGEALNNLGWVLSDGLRDYQRAEPVLRRAVAIFPLDRNPGYYGALTRWSLANCLRDQGNYADAERTYSEAVAILEGDQDVAESERAQLPDLLTDYARALRLAGKETAARALESRLPPEALME